MPCPMRFGPPPRIMILGRPENGRTSSSGAASRQSPVASCCCRPFPPPCSMRCRWPGATTRRQQQLATGNWRLALRTCCSSTACTPRTRRRTCPRDLNTAVDRRTAFRTRRTSASWSSSRRSPTAGPRTRAASPSAATRASPAPATRQALQVVLERRSGREIAFRRKKRSIFVLVVHVIDAHPREEGVPQVPDALAVRALPASDAMSAMPVGASVRAPAGRGGRTPARTAPLPARAAPSAGTLLERPPDRHRLPDRLHLRGQGRVGLGELLEVEPRNLRHHVVDRRLETGGRARG